MPAFRASRIIARKLTVNHVPDATTRSHQYTRHPMPGGTSDERIPANLGVIVGMGIDESRSNDQARGIDHRFQSIPELTNLDDFSSADR